MSLTLKLKTFSLAVAVAAAGLASAPALAQKTTLKIGWTTADGATDPYAIGARAFKEEVEKRSGGRMEVQLFPNRQLGDEKDMLEGMRFGTVDAGVITNAVIANVEPSFQINDMPFLYASEAQAHKVLDGPIGEQLAKKLAAKGVYVLGFMEGGFRNMINNRKPVAEPADVSGVKYRVMQNPVFIDMFSSLGGSAVPMAWGETFTAVQQGTIDGLEIPIAVINANKFNEVTKYLSLTNHTYSAIPLLVSKRSFDKLPDELKKIVREAGTAATAAQRKASGENVQKLVADLKAKGMQVNEIKDAAAFRQSVKPVYDKFRASIGPDLMDQALKAVQ
jgi:tripartite ATP-independent transporter DctP family solute receptor